MLLASGWREQEGREACIDPKWATRYPSLVKILTLCYEFSPIYRAFIRITRPPLFTSRSTRK